MRSTDKVMNCTVSLLRRLPRGARKSLEEFSPILVAFVCTIVAYVLGMRGTPFIRVYLVFVLLVGAYGIVVPALRVIEAEERAKAEKGVHPPDGLGS